MKESEMINIFLQAQEPNYFHYLLSAIGKTFVKVIKPIGPPSYPQWDAPTPQNHPPHPPIHQITTRTPFRPRPEYKKGNVVKDEFTPIRELYACLFKKLRMLNVLSPIERRMLNPL
ncbi:hypothetical protein R3W88_022581 [Solanum pinnatisectum]|uniref:Uncharacterized protein n=1 Tax=Solanum pinnatisectum TaxID=50273 RepID=A0AAV9LV80_9SOLN|nr:hypothetical protein R3W88_022581 [Solanum pinnatisectum]